MKTFEFSENTKFIWSIIRGWLLVGLMLFGIGVIIAAAMYASGGVAVLATFFGLGCIIAGLGGLHG